MLDYKDIIIKHFELGMSGSKIAKHLGIRKSGANDFLSAFKRCATTRFPLPKGLSNYVIVLHAHGTTPVLIRGRSIPKNMRFHAKFSPPPLSAYAFHPKNPHSTNRTFVNHMNQ